jgi:hypothetical protein
VERLALDDEIIRKHVAECATCKLRQTRIEEGQLAAMPIQKRQLIGRGARMLALLMSAIGHKRPN